MSQPLTFACPKCARRMGVGLDLMGKQVRCPHCRLVVIAPTNLPPKSKTTSGFDGLAEAVTKTPPESESQAFATSSDGEIPIPQFSVGPKEGGESIFSEPNEDDDSLFVTYVSTKPLMPELPSEPRPEQPSGTINFDAIREARENLPPTDAIESGAVPVPDFDPPVQYQPVDPPTPKYSLPTSALPSPIQTKLEEPSFFQTPVERKSEPRNSLPNPAVIESPVAAPLNPFEKLSRPQMPGIGSESVQNSPPASRPTPVAQPGRSTLFWLLVSYSLVVTLLALWGYFRSRVHPFSAIPDFFGQYRQTTRHKVSALPLDERQPIPANLRVMLGKTITVGNLHIEPMSIEERRARWKSIGVAIPHREVECLLLVLRLRNLSQDQSFHPMDPAFNRYPKPGEPAPLSGLVVGGERFLGGPIPWPFVHDGHEFLEGQEQDLEPLPPGETRVTVLPSIDGEKSKQLLTRLQSTPGRHVWQVHLRRGAVNYQSEEVSACALVGVEFESSQVKRLASR